MELRQLKYFVTVAEELQFLSASKKLFVSQPALSQQIRLLEEELGVDLFIKVKRHIYRKVELSEEGKVFLKEAKKILQLCEKAKEQVRNISLSKKSLKLGVYRMLIGERIIETLALFEKYFPEIDIKIIELPNYLAVQEGLLDETIDFGISVLPIQYKSIDWISLKRSHLSVILPQNHQFSKKDELNLEDLSQEKWIEIDSSFHPIFDSLEKYCIKAGFSRRPNIVQEVSSLEMMAQLVGMGKGIAFVPSFFDTSQYPNVVNRKLENLLIEFEQVLVFRQDRFKEMIEILKSSTQKAML